MRTTSVTVIVILESYLIIAMLRVSSQELRGTLTTAF